jgi:ATP-dependent DNA helicase RecG
VLEVEREGETREFTENWSEKALEDLAAFANTRGGTLSIGVRDDGTVIGLHAGDALVQRIVNQVVDVLGLRPRVEWRVDQEKRVIDVHIPPSGGLVACKGRYWGRVGSTNRELSPEQMAQRVVERSGKTWDALPLPDGQERDVVEPSAVRAFLRLAEHRLPLSSADEPVERVLDNLGLVEGKRLRRAAVLLFGQPQRFFPLAQSHLGRFRAGAILNDRTIAGNLFEQFNAIMDWLRGAIEIREIVDVQREGRRGMQRREEWEYPPEALREAVINALVHRDYAAPAETQIRVYDDRLEIWNPGRLLSGLRTEDLRREGHSSQLRNPLLAQAFYYAGLVERWGTGTTRMIAACQARGLLEPEFTEEFGGFRLIIGKDPYAPERLQALGLSPQQVRAVLYVRERGSIGNSEYQAITGVSKRAASRDLADLVSRGVLRRSGTRGRGIRYVLAVGQDGPERG